MDTQNSHIAEIEYQSDVAASQEHSAVQSTDSPSKPSLSETAIPFENLSVLIKKFSARERNALKVLGITTIEDFCRYDFTKLYKISGFGEKTINHLQRLQKKILRKVTSVTYGEKKSLRHGTAIDELQLRYKEVKALLSLGVVTAGDFLKVDLSRVLAIRGFGQRTHRLLTKSQERIQTILSDIQQINKLPSNEISLTEISANTLEFTPREYAVLHKNRISTLGDFARFNFHQIDVPKVNEETLQSLVTKQWIVRTKMISEKLNNVSTFSCDDECSVFLLDLTTAAKEVLWHLGMTRISELANANLSVVTHASSPIAVRFISIERTFQRTCLYWHKLKNG